MSAADDEEKSTFNYEHKIINGGTMLSISVVIPGRVLLSSAQKITQQIPPPPGFRRPKKPTAEILEVSRRDLVQRCSDTAISKSLAFHQAEVAEKTDPSVIDLLVGPDQSLSYTILISVVPLPAPEGTVQVVIEPTPVPAPAPVPAAETQ